MRLASKTIIMSPQAGRMSFDIVRGSPAREYFKYVPATASSESPVIVLVHGVTRRAAEQICRFRALADRAGAILIAPYFSRKAFGLYQQVADPKGGARADLALLDMLEAIGNETGAATERVHLFGYSGGAQFVHRFVMFYPERAATMLVASAGWYTFPDERLPYPYGIANSPLPGEIELRRLLAVERHILVGAQDTGRGDNLRVSRKIDTLQGTNRLERATRWFQAMEDASRHHDIRPPRASFEIIPGVGHSFANSASRRSLPERVMSHVFPDIAEFHQKRGIKQCKNSD